MNSTKIYVGGCYDSYQEIKQIQSELMNHGHVITYDWTKRAEEELNKRRNGEPSERSIRELSLDAELDLQGVLSADWSVFLINKKDYVYRGTFCEIGASISRDVTRHGNRRTIIISNDTDKLYAKTLCFFHHPHIIHSSSNSEVIDFIRNT
jgi:hypothetical protein